MNSIVNVALKLSCENSDGEYGRGCWDYFRMENSRSKKGKNPGSDPSFAFPPPVLSPRHLLPRSSILVASSLISLHLPLLFQPTWSSHYVIPLLGIPWWVFIMGENPNSSNSLWVSACSVYTLPLPSGFILYFSLPTHSAGLCAGPRTELSCLRWPSLCLDHFCYQSLSFQFLAPVTGQNGGNPEYPT